MLYLLKNKVFISLYLFAVLLITIFHGFIPGMGGVGTLSGRFMILGFMECGSYSLRALIDFSCTLVGGASGGLMPTGSPVYILGALIIRFFNLSPEWALLIVAFIVLSISLLGAYLLIRKFDVSRYIALPMAFLYFMTAGLMSMQAFGGTYWGALLMPSGIFAMISLLDLYRGSSLQRKIIITGLWALIATLQLFIDGYTFFMTIVAVSIIILFWSFKNINKNTFLAWCSFLFSIVFAYITYRILMPGSSSYSKGNIGVFRSMGLDVSTIFQPASNIWWGRELGLSVNASKLWGDGSNSAVNYVGFTLIALVIIGIVFTLRDKKIKMSQKLKLLSLVAILCTSFTLSLGPTLKFNEVRGELKQPITAQSYIMPPNTGVIDLPTEILYEKLPGLSAMRATYRWHLLTNLMIITISSIALQYIVRRRGYRYAIPLMALAIIELAPNPGVLANQSLSKGRQLEKFNNNVILPLNENLIDDETVLFYPNAIDNNDYLANYIAPRVGIRTYNVGNDKAVNYAKLKRPPEISKLLELNDDNRSLTDEVLLHNILKSKKADAIVIPYFDLRWNSYAWPPKTQDGKNRGTDVFNRVNSDPGYYVQNFEYFSIVRLR